MKRTATILSLLVFAVVPVAVFADTFPPFPMAFWGNVTVNGSSAPIGSVLRAYSGNTVVGQVVIQEAGIYGYTESVKQKLVVGNAVSAITFTLQNSSLNSGAEIPGTVSENFVSGSTVNRDFAFTFTVPPSGGGGGGGSGGGSGGGGSGGGGGSPLSNPTSTLSSASMSGDTNGDGKTDILDFNTLMVNWGKTEVNNPADLNKDGTVDIFDFNILMVHWTG